jgi:hypothetical protein
MGVRSIFPQRRASRGLFSNKRADPSREIMHAVHQRRRNFLMLMCRAESKIFAADCRHGRSPPLSLGNSFSDSQVANFF